MKGTIGKPQYLENSIVRHNDEPVLVREVHGNRALVRHILGCSNAGMVFARGRGISTALTEVSLSSLDINPISLGYINLQRQSVYLVRSSHRNWKQGITQSNLRGVLAGDEECSSLSFDIARAFPQLYKSIKKMYPTFEEAYSAVMHRAEDIFYNSRAFSDDFSIVRRERDVFLSYRGYGKIGSIDDNGVALDEVNRFLLTHKQEELVNELS
jgi:hypothetical protein